MGRKTTAWQAYTRSTLALSSYRACSFDGEYLGNDVSDVPLCEVVVDPGHIRTASSIYSELAIGCIP